MKARTLITRDGTIVNIYFEEDIKEVVVRCDKTFEYIIDADLNEANHTVWLVENQSRIVHRKVLEDKVALDAERQSLEQNIDVADEVQCRKVEAQVQASIHARGYEEFLKGHAIKPVRLLQ